MKKVLTITLVLITGMWTYGQIPRMNRSLVNKSVKVVAKKHIRDISDFTMPINPTVSSIRNLDNGTTIGITWYDLFTNATNANNLFMFDDGTISAGWTYGVEATSFPDRGTGYNYYNGDQWGSVPSQRLESLKTGWGHVSDLGGGGEIVIAHDANDLEMSRRETKGSGDWTEFNYAGVAVPSWPRHVTSGENNEYLHLIYHSYDAYGGMPGAMLYSRSMDGGDTWNPADIILDGTGPDYLYEIQGETYSLAARGNTVAILVTGSWNDMFIMKSEDNGDNWEKIMIWEHPYPFFNFDETITDTTFCPDNSGQVAIDSQGNCHVVFGISRTLHEDLSTNFDVFPYVDGIGYWNESMPAFSNDLDAMAPPQLGYANSEMVENYNYIGWTQDVDGDGEITFYETTTGLPMTYPSYGLSTMPTIHIDDQDRIFVVYASTTETYHNFEWNYKKLWECKNFSGAWGGYFEHLTQDISFIFDESIYPYIADVSDNDFYYMLFQDDGTPGLALDGDHEYQENSIIVMDVLKNPIGIEENAVADNLLKFENYPNPFSETTTITALIDREAEVALIVTDLCGQQMMDINHGRIAKGTHFFKVDRGNWPAGIYFYTLRVDNKYYTRKMVAL